jgi:hypothetical protein
VIAMSSPRLQTSEQLLICRACGTQYDECDEGDETEVGKKKVDCRVCDVRFSYCAIFLSCDVI